MPPYPDLHILLLGDVPDHLINHIIAFWQEPALPWRDGHDVRYGTVIRVGPGIGVAVNTQLVPVNTLSDYYRRLGGFSEGTPSERPVQLALDGCAPAPDTSLFVPYLAPEGMSSYDLLWHSLRRFLPESVYQVLAREIRTRRSAEQKQRYYRDPSKALRRAERERKRIERQQQAQAGPKRPRGRPKGSKNKPKG